VCDGMELRGNTCLGLGYSGGTLTCTSACGLDTSACTRCSPLDTSLLWCGNAPVDAVAPWMMALAATETEVGLAWVSLDASDYVRLHFARFAPDLSLLDQKILSGPVCPHALALAARPGGWSLAVESGEGLHLLALDASGVQTAALQVFAEAHFSASILAARPAAEPLLVWIPPSSSDGSQFRAALVNPGGASLAPATNIAAPFPLVDRQFSVAATADGWLLALRASESSATDTIYIAPLAANGALAGPFQAPFGTYVEHPRLTAFGNEVRMTFGKFENGSGGVSFSRLTPAGKALGSRAVIGPGATYYGEAPPVPVGADTFVLLPTATGNGGEAERLDVVRVNETGAQVYAPRTIVGDPQRIHSHTIARRGSDVIVAWINGVPGAHDPWDMGPAGIGLARVVP
jgi:hypothetical protein